MIDEKEDRLVFAVVDISIVSKNFTMPASFFVHESYSTARALVSQQNSLGRGTKAIMRNVRPSDLLRAQGSIQILRNISDWKDVTADEHFIQTIDDKLSARKVLG